MRVVQPTSQQIVTANFLYPSHPGYGQFEPGQKHCICLVLYFIRIQRDIWNVLADWLKIEDYYVFNQLQMM